MTPRRAGARPTVRSTTPAVASRACVAEQIACRCVSPRGGRPAEAESCTKRYTGMSRTGAGGGSLPVFWVASPSVGLGFPCFLRCARPVVRRLFLLSVMVLAGAVLAEEPNPVLEEARSLMHEGLERDLPAPTPRGPPQWPSATPVVPPKKEDAPGQLKKDALGEQVRNEASLRARVAAEERRASPENNQGVGQSRTRAAKETGPKPRPPRP